MSVEGHFLERFVPGSLAKTIRERKGKIRALFEHGLDLILERQVIADIDEIREEPDGAYCRATLLGGVPDLIVNALSVFLVGTGMRPEEALALEWRDVDKANGVASIERVHSQGRTKPCMKSDRQRRRIPLRAKVLEALDSHPRRLDSRLVFPAHHNGDYLKLGTFYLRQWRPGLRAAGIEKRGVYAVSAHLRRVVDRGRSPASLPESDHGNVRNADRRDLRASRA